METDITPIFKNDVRESEQGEVPTRPKFEEDTHPTTPDFVSPPEHDQEFTPMNEIQDEEQYHPMMHQQQQQQQHPYYWQPPPPQITQTEIQQWDPFKNVSTSTWVILVLAFALGFFIGKFK
tara:strand:+ start:17492 stop:17854 length:363 start_codon:yes stop_codon:yes gene_type:complete